MTKNKDFDLSKLNDIQKNDYCNHLSHQIEREDGLVNNRLTWILTTQGLLFTAFALTASEGIDPNIKDILLKALPWIGLLVGLVGCLGILAANLAIQGLKKQWRVLNYNYVPRPFGGDIISIFGLIPCLSLPIIFIAAWIYISCKMC